MYLPQHLNPYKIIPLLLFSFYFRSFSQCSPQTGAPPPTSGFNTGGITAGITDQNWKIAKDSINGIYEPAIVMSPLPAIYYDGVDWISFSTTGEHSGSRYFFYKMDFTLPCFNLCGKSYNEDNTFCLYLDLYADNSIYEIFVNDVAQSPNLGNIIPLANPYNPVGHTQSDPTSVSLCKNWKAGSNTIIIQVASSATVAGILVQGSANPPTPPGADTVRRAICEGEIFQFGDLEISKPGNYFHSFPKPGGCDSNVVLSLDVKTKSFTEIDQSICEGETYSGHNISGTYVETFTAANGCDSIRKLNLIVADKPAPVIKTNAAICRGDSLLLSPGLFLSYLWQDGSVKDHFVAKTPGLYHVTVTNACGSARVETMVTGGICDVFFPNAFTPNNDGKNDFFKVLSDLRFREYHLSIFNKWGQKIFETSEPAKGWDGNFNGMEQQPGVFTWKCTFNKSNNTTSMKGTVTLLR